MALMGSSTFMPKTILQFPSSSSCSPKSLSLVIIKCCTSTPGTPRTSRGRGGKTYRVMQRPSSRSFTVRKLDADGVDAVEEDDISVQLDGVDATTISAATTRNHSTETTKTTKTTETTE